MATLQQQYNLIKEGKGDKQFFLKSAKHQFPDYITSLTDFNTAIHILKTKNILNEEAKAPQAKKDWFKIFEAEVKAHNKEMEKDLVDLETKNFDYKDEKNIDNLYGQSFLMGYLAEMGDPKNTDKTVGELKDIVAKNMAKDVNYYHKNASFGVKGIGYTQQEPSKDPKGKHKSSGYGELSEAKRPSIANHIKEVEKTSARVALEAKINAIDEAIEKRKSKLALAESEDLAEMIDKSMVKVLNKEIKELEKYKAKTEKLYEKMTGGAKEEIIDEVEKTEEPTSENYDLSNLK
jgi:flagellar hook-basal body complex protein FliE